MNKKDKPKLLQPQEVHTKKGIKYKALYTVVVDGVRKRRSAGNYDSFKAANDAAEDMIDDIVKNLNEDLIETSMSLGAFLDKYYWEWYRANHKTENFSSFIRYLKENKFDEVPLQEIKYRWCVVYREKIAYLKRANGKEYKELNNVYVTVSGHLNNALKLATKLGYIKRNYNDRIPNPHTNDPRWMSEKKKQYFKNKDIRTRTWSAEQVAKYLPLFKTISDTQLVKKDARPAAKSRKANVMKSDNAEAWKVYWTDNDGKYRSKNFNWQKLKGRERAKVLADKYAEEVTKTLEQSDGSYITEIKTFRDIDPIMWWAYFCLTLLLGLRNSEAAGLKFEDFDQKAGYVQIERRYVLRTKKGKREVVYDDPKADSFRRIKYGKQIQQVLDALSLYYQTNETNTDNHLLQYRTGGAIIPSYWYQNYRKAQDRAGIPKEEQLMSTHKARHTNLSMLAKANISPQKIIARAGHKDFNTTMQYYIAIDDDDESADVLDNIVESKPNQEVNNGI
jgi:integrase